MAPISGARLVESVLFHPEGGLGKLIELAGGQETDWLEFKAAIREPNDDTMIRADLAWHVGRAIVAMINTSGGAVLIGFDDKGRPIGLESSDPNKLITTDGIETFVRREIAPVLLPETGKWSTSKGVCKVDPGRFRSHITLRHELVDNQYVIVCMVRPAEKDLLDVEHVQHNVPRNILLIREQGMGRIRELVRRHEWDEYALRRDIFRADLAALAAPYCQNNNATGVVEGRATDPAVTEALMQRIATALQDMPNGGSTHQIMHRLGTEERVDQVSSALCCLQERGVVRLIGGATWKVPLFDDTFAVQQNPVEDYGGWDTARKMFRYYADCIEDEAGGMCKSYANGEGQTFIRVAHSIPWDDLIFGESLIVPYSAVPEGFLKQPSLVERNYFLGCPTLCVWSPRLKRMTAVVPVFILPVRLRLLNEQRQLVIRPTGPVQVNSSWLTYTFKDTTDQQQFVEQLGLGTSQRAEFGIPVPSRMSVLQEGLRFFVGKEWKGSSIRALEKRLENYTEGGYFDLTILMRRDPSTITGRLLEELRTLADPIKVSDEQLDKTALAPLFAKKTTEMGTMEYPLDIAHVDVLGLEQQQAIRIARDSNVGVIQGPPGTGKSRVIKNIMIDHALNGRSVLFASGNHQALEAVLPSVNKEAELLFYAVRLSYPFQQGNPDATKLNPLLDPLRHLARNEGQCSQEEIDAFERYAQNIKEASDRFQKYKDALEQLAELEMQRSETDAQLQTEWETNFTGRPFSAQTLVELHRHLASKEELNRDLAKFKRLSALSGNEGLIAKWLKTWFAYWAKKTIARASSLGKIFKERPTASGDYIALINAVNRALAVHRMCAMLDQKNASQIEIDGFYTLELLRDAMSKASENAHNAARALLKQQAKICGHSIEGKEKELLDAMVKAMSEKRAPAYAMIKRMMDKAGHDFSWFCKHFPLWGVTNLSVGKFVPLKEGLFDLLIIDEATQCNIASVIPLLFRAKRALIAGDPEQLQFVASIHRRREEQLRAKHGFLEAGWFFRFLHHKQSMFGLAASSALVSGKDKQFLRDHFRCQRTIADYFNKNFYNERLFINTPRPRFSGETIAFGIRWTGVAGDAQPATGGGAISQAQINAITNELRKLKEIKFPGTVGVVTPFSAQANRINDRIEKEFGRDIPQHWDFKASTADGFQGGERDVILFSLVGGDNMPRGSSWFYEQDRNRFNVAVSRARVLLHVFGDRDWVLRWSAENPAQRSHLAQLVAYAELSENQPQHSDWVAWRNEHPNDPPIIGDRSRIGPIWEPDFARRIYQRGFPVVQQLPQLGRFLDITIQDDDNMGARLDVEVDGEAYHRDTTGQRRVEDIERDIILIANGWTVKRFWVYELRENMEQCVENVVTTWNEMTGAT